MKKVVNEISVSPTASTATSAASSSASLTSPSSIIENRGRKPILVTGIPPPKSGNSDHQADKSKSDEISEDSDDLIRIPITTPKPTTTSRTTTTATTTTTRVVTSTTTDHASQASTSTEAQSNVANLGKKY